MPRLPGMADDVYWGDTERPLPDWRADADPDDDAPLSDEDRAALVAVLGFDPREGESVAEIIKPADKDAE